MRISDWSSDVCSSDLMMAVSAYNMGSSGTIEQDDTDTWPHMTRNARGAMGKRQTLKYGALLGENKPDDWPGGGSVYDGFTKDDNQWKWWLAYRDLMLARDCRGQRCTHPPMRVRRASACATAPTPMTPRTKKRRGGKEGASK